MTISIEDLLKRRLVWDTVPCSVAREMIAKVGLVPASDAGNDVEHKASHRRLNRLYPIQDELILNAALAGEVIGRAILENQGIEVPDDVSDPELQQYIKVVHAGVVGVMANLLEDGIISLNVGVPA